MDNYIRRKRNHDYCSPCHYHIIIKKNPNFPLWGKVIGNPDIENRQPGCAEIEKTLAGKIIGSHIFNLPKKNPSFGVKIYKVMPNHVHFFLQVKEFLEKPLGTHINGLKHEIADEYSLKTDRKFFPLDIFSENYTDKIIYKGQDFSRIIGYIDDNPRRLAFMKKYPGWFERKEVRIDGDTYEAFGNHFLLDNPFKMVVRGHRSNTPADNNALEECCVEHAESGGVLVSPFINPAEKSARKKAKEKGGRIIQIVNEPFTEKFKPARKEFYECTKGNLLILAPKGWSFGKISRVSSQKMNRLAERLVELQFC